VPVARSRIIVTLSSTQPILSKYPCNCHERKIRSARRSYGAVFQTDVGFRVIRVQAKENDMRTRFAGNEATTILSWVLSLILDWASRVSLVLPGFECRMVGRLLGITRPRGLILIALVTPVLLNSIYATEADSQKRLKLTHPAIILASFLAATTIIIVLVFSRPDPTHTTFISVIFSLVPFTITAVVIVGHVSDRVEV
jgi:hypothetical protein